MQAFWETAARIDRMFTYVLDYLRLVDVLRRKSGQNNRLLGQATHFQNATRPAKLLTVVSVFTHMF